MLKIAIILGSTRPKSCGVTVAQWVNGLAGKRADAELELVDVAKLGLPLLDEELPPALGQYARQHTREWAAKVALFDAFVFVTPEYNHSVPAALKMPSTSSTRSGLTRRPDSSATAWQAVYGRWNTCA